MPNNLHCVEPEELMAYADGELPASRAARVRIHLEGCRECQDASENFGKLSWRLHDWPVGSPDFAAPVLPPAMPRRSPNRWFQSAAVLCGVALLFAVMLIWQRKPSHFLFESKNEHFKPTRPDSHETTQSFSNPAVPVMLAPAQPNANAPPVSQAPQTESDAQAPLIAQSARIALVAKDFATVEKSIDQILNEHHGYVAQMTLNAPTGAPHTLEASLRAPVAELESTINNIKSLGRVESETRTGEEVTQQSVDLDARLLNARHTLQRLTELLKQRTGKLSDVLAVEQQIDGTQSEIERMEAERKNLTHRVGFASVDVSVSEQYEAPLAGMSSPWSAQLRNAAVQGLTAVEDMALGLLISLLARGPTLLLWLLILYLGFYLLWRRFGPISLSWWKHDQ